MYFGVCDDGCAAITGKNGRNSCERLSSGSNFNDILSATGQIPSLNKFV